MPRKQNKQRENIDASKRKKQAEQVARPRDPVYLWNMADAPKSDESLGVIQSLPLIFFTAFVILIVRMVDYTRPMESFPWAGGNDSVDFFSYGKMVAIIICAALTLLFILYRVFAQSLAVKRTFVYIPIIVYSIFVILSYVFSDYKEFSLLGYNDRFEGTLVLISYMVLLFYTINTVNTEKNIKFVLYPVAVSSGLLGILGITQASGHDFFQTKLGGMMITPREFWPYLDELIFQFTNREIYQTIYNINYVAFYLTLLLPVFGLLFIRSVMEGDREKLYKKIVWGGLFALLVFNMIGSASSGGYLGMGAVVVASIVLLNKRILPWWKPLVMLLVMTLVVGGITFDRWLPELENAVRGVFAVEASAAEEPHRQADGTVADEAQQQDDEFSQTDETAPGESQDQAQIQAGAPVPGIEAVEEAPPVQPAVTAAVKSRIDYIEVSSELNMIEMSINGNEFAFYLEPEEWPAFEIYDADGNTVGLGPADEAGELRLLDERFNMCTVRGMLDNEDNSYFIINIDGKDWVFLVVQEGTFYINDLGKISDLKKIETIGFENNQHFGTDRGYIWSRTLPMMRDTVLLGYGADTYCLYFPQNDYVGKYNTDLNSNLIIDKPHNMYMHMAVGTGGISLLAFLALLAFYFIQSVKIYRRGEITGFSEFVGLGIFLGILGFSVTGLVDDSSVSVMPLFYGLLGTGISVNMMLKRLRHS